jgi:nitroimidazol reductase NimA-like FMN-containing flavoprotein (pyridoxamine 5'-phosphate oxidase superfamily)
MTTTPRFSGLDEGESLRLLERNHVGRLAFFNGPRVDIRPLGYVANGRWIFLRTAPGEKIAATEHTPYVAFEVDEVEGPFDWRSVVVHGSVHRLPEDGSPIEQRELARAVAELRRVMPAVFGPHDPVPDRQIVLGIHVHEITGRAARTG